jgi:hypothetical protein
MGKCNLDKLTTELFSECSWWVYKTLFHKKAHVLPKIPGIKLAELQWTM